jgi:hypothetical protein
MTALKRCRVALTGFVGGPGVATYYFLDTATAQNSLHSLWVGLASWLPTSVTVQVEPGGDIIDDVTGNLTGSWGGDIIPSIQGQANNGYASPVGALLKWQTDTIADGHRLRGRTFLVPLDKITFQTNGQMAPATAASMAALAGQFVIEQSSSFVVWHRPFAGRAATAKLKAKPAHDGGHGLVTLAAVGTKPVVLRSRRD